MPIIIPPPGLKKEAKKNEKEEEKIKKIVVYFRKEFDATDLDSYKKLVEAIKKAQELDLFDDIYIVKGKDVLDLIEFKEQYHLATLNEVYHIKKEIITIKSVVHGLLQIVKNLRKHLEKMYEKI